MVAEKMQAHDSCIPTRSSLPWHESSLVLPGPSFAMHAQKSPMRRGRKEEASALELPPRLDTQRGVGRGHAVEAAQVLDRDGELSAGVMDASLPVTAEPGKTQLRDEHGLAPTAQPSEKRRSAP